jgi:hypothetical protein
MTDAVGGAYDGIAESLRVAHPELTAEQARLLGKFYFVLVQGLALLWLLGPEMELPDGDDLAAAIAVLRGEPGGAPGRRS